MNGINAAANPYMLNSIKNKTVESDNGIYTFDNPMAYTKRENIIRHKAADKRQTIDLYV